MKLSEYIESEIYNIVHENKKLRWSVSPSGNYVLSNRSTVRPIYHEFSAEAPVREIITDTRLGDFVYVSTVKGRKFTFSVVKKIL